MDGSAGTTLQLEYNKPVSPSIRSSAATLANKDSFEQTLIMISSFSRNTSTIIAPARKSTTGSSLRNIINTQRDKKKASPQQL